MGRAPLFHTAHGRSSRAPPTQASPCRNTKCGRTTMDWAPGWHHLPKGHALVPVGKSTLHTYLTSNRKAHKHVKPWMHVKYTWQDNDGPGAIRGLDLRHPPGLLVGGHALLVVLHSCSAVQRHTYRGSTWHEPQCGAEPTARRNHEHGPARTRVRPCCKPLAAHQATMPPGHPSSCALASNSP